MADPQGMTQCVDVKMVAGFVFSHKEPSVNLVKFYGCDEWGKLPDIAEMVGNEYNLSIPGKRVTPENAGISEVPGGFSPLFVAVT